MFEVRHIHNNSRCTVYAVMGTMFLVWGEELGAHGWTWMPMTLFRPEEKLSVGAVAARWEHLGGDEWCCTQCGTVITTEGSWQTPSQKYCSECGASMKGRL